MGGGEQDGGGFSIDNYRNGGNVDCNGDERSEHKQLHHRGQIMLITMAMMEATTVTPQRADNVDNNGDDSCITDGR